MAANYIVVVEKEGSEPMVVGFETAEEAESWCKIVNDAGERVRGGGFHNYARTPVQPLNPTEAAKKILDETEDELGLDSDGETAVDAEGNIWRHMHQEHDGECACYWYWDSPEGRWVTRDLPCAHRGLQHLLYAAEFEATYGVYWFRPGQDRTFRVPSWNITSLPGHWTHWGQPSIEEQPREFTLHSSGAETRWATTRARSSAAITAPQKTDGSHVHIVGIQAHPTTRPHAKPAPTWRPV